MSTTYSGSCHCGNVQFDVTADINSVLSCNCSHCSRKGFLLTFAPADQFTLKSGEDQLSEYRFNKHLIAHKFCRNCGTQPFAYGAMPDGSPVRAVNVRCLEGIDLDSLEVQHVDGKSA